MHSCFTHHQNTLANYRTLSERHCSSQWKHTGQCCKCTVKAQRRSIKVVRWCSGAQAGGVSQKSTGVRSGVLLVPVVIREPHPQNLSEAEKQADPSYKAESLSSMFLDLVCTGQTGMVREASSVTGDIGVHVFETAAVEALLHIPLSALRVIPAHLQQVILLLSVDGQTSTGNRKLHNKHHEQDDHVEKKQDLVMLHRPNEASQGHKEEENAHTDDATHHLETGDQAEPLPPCCDANQQQAHHYIEDVERAQGVFGAGESGAAHLAQRKKPHNKSFKSVRQERFRLQR